MSDEASKAENYAGEQEPGVTSNPSDETAPKRLSPAQIDVLIAAAGFVKAGEWPWDEHRPDVLDRAVEKLHAMRGGRES